MMHHLIGPFLIMCGLAVVASAGAEDSVSWHALAVSQDGFYGTANDMDDEEAALDAAEEACFAASEMPDTCTAISMSRTADDGVGWMGSALCDSEPTGAIVYVAEGDSAEAAFDAAVEASSELPNMFCEGMYALSTDGEVVEFDISDDPE